MGFFDQGYDRDFDQNYRSANPYPGRSYRGGPGSPIRTRYGAGYGQFERGSMAWSPYGSGPGYDEEYRGPGYDRNYGSRWQTDYGDPFGDRIRQTPIRVIRGEPRRYDRGFLGGRRRGRRETYPFGYTPYDRRAGYDIGYRPRSGGFFGRGYDRDWY